MFQFHFYLSLFHVLYFMSIFASIFCIVRDLSALEVVVYYLLIGKMVGLGYWDEFPMVSALMCMVTH